ncbi:MAG: class I SAM-dependent methyltransferase [Nitrososphaeria archaeon]
MFGKALMAFYEGDPTPCNIQRDDGYTRQHDLALYFRVYEDWPDYEKSALEYVRGRVLDIGCGAGRHALYLQEKNFEVVAVDASPLAVEVARLRGVKDCSRMYALQLDFPPKSFDTVLLMGNNFGIAGNVEDTKKLLNSLSEFTTRSARVITTCRNPLQTNKPEHLVYHDLNRRRGRPIGQITIRTEYKGELNDWFDLLMVEPEVMAEICAEAHWGVETLFESEDTYSSVLTKQ